MEVFATVASVISSDGFHDNFYNIITPFSMASNGLLIVIVYHTKQDALGSYRYLILTFAISNIVTSLIHHATQLCILFENGNFFVYSRFGNQYRSENGWKGSAGFIAYVVAHTNTFLLLASQYVYRLKQLNSFSLSNWDPTQFFIWAIVFGVLNIVVTAIGGTAVLASKDRSFVTDSLVESAGIDLRDPQIGFCAGVVRITDSNGNTSINFTPILGLFCPMAFNFATTAVIFYCIVKIRHVLKTSLTLCAQTRAMQRFLFRALLIQTAVPCLFAYIPAAAVGVSVVMGRNLNANAVVLCTGIFPAVDGVFVIALIRPYRNTLLSWFRLGKSILPKSYTAVSDIRSNTMRM